MIDGSDGDPDPHVFCASWIRIYKSEIRIRILPFSQKGVEQIEIMLAK
jgi:hypothetical protein